jgi:hypothetical protein
MWVDTPESWMCSETLGDDWRGIQGTRFLAAGVIVDPVNVDLKMLLRWPTADLPEGMEVTAAWLRLTIGTKQIGSLESTDANATLAADWYDWGAECDADDVEAEASDPALSGCGAPCVFGNLEERTYRDFPLDDAAAHIARGEDATTALRLGMAPSGPTGQAVLGTLRSSGALKGPGLVVQLCPPTLTPTPSNTPTSTGTPTPTSIPTLTTTPTLTATPTISPTPTLTGTPTPTSTPAPTLVVEIVAEHGVGDGQPATDVPVGMVADIAADDDGNIYFVDVDHHRVRHIDTDGNIHTIMRTIGSDPIPAGAVSLKSVAVDRDSGAVYVADEIGNRVWTIVDDEPEVFAGTDGEDGGDDGPATEARLIEPEDLDVGSDGTLYIAEHGADRIRSVSSNGTISTVASSLPVDLDSCMGFSFDTVFRPSLIAVAPDDSLYVVGKSEMCIARILTNSTIEGVRRLGSHAHGLSVSDEGTVVVSAWRLLSLDGDEWISAFEDLPQRFGAVAMAGSDIIAYEEDASQIVQIDSEGTSTVIAGNGTRALYGDGGPAVSAAQARIVALGPPVQANTQPASTYRHSVNVAALAGGGFVVVWEGPSFAGFARYFDATGTPVGEPFELEGVFLLSQDFAVPAVAPLLGGGFVTASGLNSEIRLSAFGTGGRLRASQVVKPPYEHTRGFALSSASEDRTALVWSDGFNFYAQRFDGDLSLLGGISVAAPYDYAVDEFGYSDGLSVASQPNGGLVIAWWDESFSKVWARLVSPQDEPEGETFLVADGVDQGDLPSVCVDQDGSFIVAWIGRLRGMEFRRYGQQGVPLTPRLNSGLGNDPSLVCLPEGRFVVTSGPSVREFDAENRGVGHSAVSTSDFRSYPAMLTASELVVAWHVCDESESECSVFIQRLGLEPGGYCPGDCNNDGEVTIDELILAVGFALRLDAETDPERACNSIRYCPLVDTDLNCQVTVAEIIAAVDRALERCE